METKQSIMKKILIYFILFPFLAFGQKQEKENIYIYFDKEDIRNSYSETDKEEVIFWLNPKFDKSHFIHNKKKHSKECINYDRIESKLITQEEANKKVVDYLKKRAKEFEKQTGVKGLPPVPPFSYNSYFKKIYIYVEKDLSSGILYEVDWQYAIE